MRPIESKFKIREEDINQHNYFSKLVDEAALFEVFPHLVTSEMLEPSRRQIASYARGNIIGPDGTLMRVFEQNAKKVNTSSEYIEWRLYTNEGDVRASFIRNYVSDSNTTPGRGNSIFQIGLDVDWFGPNDLLIFEGLREIPIMVVSEPDPDGMAWVYDVKLVDDNPASSFPIQYLELGTRLLQAGSPISEAAIQRGNVHFGMGEAFIEFQVPMTRMGWEMEITDKAHLASKNYRVQSKDEETIATWKHNNVNIDKDSPGSGVLVNSLEMKFMNAVNHQKDLWMTYGRAAGQFAGKFLDGVTERELRTSPGLLEFMETSYKFDHSPEANIVTFFKDHITPLWHDKVNPENRVLHVYTGTGGLKNLQRDAKALDIDGVLASEELNYTIGDGYFPGRNGVTLGAKQYRGVYIEPFGLVMFHYLPFLDSDLVETRTYKGLPLTSYEYIVFDYGFGDGRDSNIYVLNNEEVEQYGYICGTWTPMGPLNAKGRSLAGRFSTGLGRKNAFMYYHECAFGFVVKDPGYMIWVRPAVS